MNKLTPKQQAFANAIIEGKNPSEAYRCAYSYQHMSKKAIAVNAQKLLKHTKISLAIEKGKQEATKKSVWSREKAIERLQDVNAISYQAMKKQGVISAPVASAFFNSLDRLNAMCEVETASEFGAPRFYFKREEMEINAPIIIDDISNEEETRILARKNDVPLITWGV